MKVIRNNILYVEAHDLNNIEILNYDSNDTLIEISDINKIELIKNREDILDYDYIKSLTSNELNELLNEIKKKHDVLCLKYLKSSQFNRKLLDKDLDYKNIMKKYKYLYDELKNYINNKEEIDHKFSKVLSNSDITLIK